MSSRIFRPALLVGVAVLILLSACTGGKQPLVTVAPTQPQVVGSTQAPAATLVPTKANTYPTPQSDTPAPLAYPAPAISAYPGPSASDASYPAPAAETAAVVATQPVARQANSTALATATASTELVATDPITVQLAAGKPQLIMFFAFWDGISKSMAPLMHTLENDYAGKVKFVYLDIDDPNVAQIKQQLGFKVQPQFYLIDAKGNVLKQWSGSVPETDLRAALDASLK